MKKAVKNHRCDDAPYCGALRRCAAGAISFDRSERKIIIDENKCIGCGICEMACPRSAISMEEK